MNEKLRKDSWTEEEDNLLKEIILNKINGGHTQISGFQEASVLLGRSKQACAFRWNKNLRPQIIKKEQKSTSYSTKEFADSSSLQNHLQLAMESYDDMKHSYDEISSAYNLLKNDYEQLLNWVKQGITHIERK
ncbi:transcriptional regulator [Psychrobacillus antarcticus]|uniref:transcriptional regulator n=1 Tax=Psychrobacillus antarcticus TaxID=2879115 RepID=UPI00240851D2|nr:transcriptional regulator [Psychrobacillus antarcticus]